MTDLDIPWIRPELAQPSPYRWQEGIPDEVVARFDLNTLPLNPSWWPGIARTIAAQSVSSYPEADYAPLKRAIASYLGIDAACVVPTAGGDEAILLTAWLALGRGDRAVVGRPTYQLHAASVRMTGAEVDLVDPLPGPGLRLDLDTIAEKAKGARLVWLCSPNNPTGEDIPADKIREIAANCEGLVCVDQAYLEFGGSTDHLALLDELPNIVFIRTFSKGWGMGALRAGYAIANPLIAGAMDALRPPGSLSTGSALGAELACAHADTMRVDTANYRTERERLSAGFRELGLEIIGEAANFVCARTPWSGDELFSKLASRGLIVRTFGHEPLLADAFRACVAVPADNDKLLAALADLLGKPAPAPADPTVGASTFGRGALIERRTKETDIRLRATLDGSGNARIATGVGFLDHMLTALGHHSLMDLELACTGDTHIDPHHTVEDCGIVLGQAIDAALGDRAGITRFGDASAPLDEALGRATVDFSGRGSSTVRINFTDTMIGELPTSLIPHLIDCIAINARATIHVEATGEDDHHIAEAAFKALARALREAWTMDPRRGTQIASTKGSL
jgi:histidinol-phosphate aminotransferase